MKKAKVLLVFCNWEGPSTPPLGVTSIATHLISKGHDAIIFDDAPYMMDKARVEKNLDPREENLSVKQTDRTLLYTLPFDNLFKDFMVLLRNYKPDIVGISSSRYGFLNCVEYLKVTKEQFPNIMTVVGGAFAMSVPDKVIAHDCVDIVATGDGEIVMETLCAKAVNEETDTLSIAGTWAKDENGKIHENPIKEMFDCDQNPPLRFDLFDERRFYRPIGGAIRRVLPLEISRGCPYGCSNCSVPLFEKNHRHIGKWFRIKSIEKIEENIINYLDLYKPEYFFFMSPTFLGFPKDYTKKFIEMYSKYRIPFYMFTRPECVNEEELAMLKDIGLNKMSVGIECGNEKYRKEMLGRNYSNDLLRKAFGILGKLDLAVTTNVIIGLPEETSEMLFETIRLVKEIATPKTDITISIYQAYERTKLHKFCIENNYSDPEKIENTNVFTPSVLNPNMSQNEIAQMSHKLNLYVQAEERDWPEIDKIDVNTEEGKASLRKLIRKYSIEREETEEGYLYHKGKSKSTSEYTENAEERKEIEFPTPFSHC